MALVTLTKAKQQLEIPLDDSSKDAAVSLAIDHAEALIVGRCNSTAHWRAITSTWTEATVPGGVQRAILALLTHLYQHRGDDMANDVEVWKALDQLIAMHRDQVIA